MLFYALITCFTCVVAIFRAELRCSYALGTIFIDPGQTRNKWVADRPLVPGVPIV